MKVSEIFYSIQGEGVSVGKPAVFVRLSICNLRCPFCDTKYSWYEGNEMSVDDVVKRVRAFPANRVVWTGGEPTLQLREIEEAVKQLKKYKHEIESNATLLFDSSLFDVVTLSPKKEYINKKVISNMKDRENVYFKFVVDNVKDFEYFDSLVKKMRINEEKVYFQPIGTNLDEILKVSKWLVEFCLKHGYNYSPRLHIMLWGNVRGR